MDKMHTWWCKENGYEKMEVALSRDQHLMWRRFRMAPPDPTCDKHDCGAIDQTALCQQWFDRHEKREKGEKPAAPKDPKERPPMEDIQVSSELARPYDDASWCPRVARCARHHRCCNASEEPFGPVEVDGLTCYTLGSKRESFSPARPRAPSWLSAVYPRGCRAVACCVWFCISRLIPRSIVF